MSLMSPFLGSDVDQKLSRQIIRKVIVWKQTISF